MFYKLCWCLSLMVRRCRIWLFLGGMMMSMEQLDIIKHNTCWLPARCFCTTLTNIWNVWKPSSNVYFHVRLNWLPWPGPKMFNGNQCMKCKRLADTFLIKKIICLQAAGSPCLPFVKDLNDTEWCHFPKTQFTTIAINSYTCFHLTTYGLCVSAKCALARRPQMVWP